MRRKRIEWKSVKNPFFVVFVVVMPNSPKHNPPTMLQCELLPSIHHCLCLLARPSSAYKLHWNGF